MNICILGDSITWGANDYERGGWVERLKVHCMERYDDIDIYNLGISGNNTDDLLERFEVEATRRDPNLIIFAIGINDSQYIEEKNNVRVKISRFSANLSNLFNTAKKMTNNIIFVGLIEVDESKTMPTLWNIKKYYDNDNVKKYNKVIGDFCEEREVQYINIEKVINKDDLEDGLHPNSQGHEKIFQKILMEIKQFLEDER
ncbi:MAG TPA: hypothetical protein ENN31_01490 [Candidatus Vogelbacteria bacterium]|nr:hypothetical protein [Candidatus Vogelbacteria bacterium]